MMPAIDPRYDARRKRARVAVFITAGAIVASSALGVTRFSGWRWLPWALGISLIIVFCAVSMNSGGSPRGRRGSAGSAVVTSLWAAAWTAWWRTGGTGWSWCRG